MLALERAYAELASAIALASSITATSPLDECEVALDLLVEAQLGCLTMIEVKARYHPARRPAHLGLPAVLSGVPMSMPQPRGYGSCPPTGYQGDLGWLITVTH